MQNNFEKKYIKTEKFLHICLTNLEFLFITHFLIMCFHLLVNFIFNVLLSKDYLFNIFCIQSVFFHLLRFLLQKLEFVLKHLPLLILLLIF